MKILTLIKNIFKHKKHIKWYTEEQERAAYEAFDKHYLIPVTDIFAPPIMCDLICIINNNGQFPNFQIMRFNKGIWYLKVFKFYIPYKSPNYYAQIRCDGIKVLYIKSFMNK